MRTLTAIVSLALVIPHLLFTPITIKKVLLAEYRVWYLMSDGNIWGYSNNGGAYIKNWGKPSGVTSWNFATVGYNYVIALDQAGHFWYTKVFFLDPTDGWYQEATDTTGATIAGAFYANSFSSANIFIAADSSLWYGGLDVYSYYYAGGSIFNHTGKAMKYTQFSAPGLKFKKVAMGGTSIMALATDGSVYRWTPGNLTPTHYITARPAVDVFASAIDAWGYIMPNAAGDQTMGYPYMAGTYPSLWGGSSSLATPTSLQTLWNNMTVPIKKFCIDWNTIHYIDSSGRLWGCGWNPFGQVGNGQEFIGRYTYGGYPNYAWSFNNQENPTGKPVQIGTDTDWRDLYPENGWYNFYNYALKTNDSAYSWGRNKANLLGNGFQGRNWTLDNSNIDNSHYNVLDVLSPTLVTPISARTQLYDATPPTVDAANQSITTSSTTITCTGNMLQVVAVAPVNNGVPVVCCSIVSHSWTQISGPNTPTLTNANTATVSISGMVNGTYIFQDFVSDNNSGQDTVQAQVIVNIPPTNQRIHYKFHKNISRKI